MSTRKGQALCGFGRVTGVGGVRGFGLVFCRKAELPYSKATLESHWKMQVELLLPVS